MLTIPGGKDKGKPVTDASESTLKWWAENANRADLKQACADELQRRMAGGTSAAAAAPTSAATQPQARTASTAIAVKDLSGAFRDSNRVTQMLQAAAEQAHLVAPAPVCGTLPDGCEVAISAVLIQPGAETYPIAGEGDDETLGLSKVALDKIAAALGVSWDPIRSGRLDDGSDPYYWHHRAVGIVHNFDGSPRIICGEKEVDMRPGSPQCESIRAREEKKKERLERQSKKYFGDLGESQIREMRLFISGHAETKARLRAIRSLGIRTSYKRHELAKPFVCAKTIFTGQSDDPEARREFRQGIMQTFLGAERALFGQAPAPAPAQQQITHHQVIHAPAAHRPPPVGTVIDVDDQDLRPATDPQAQATQASEPPASNIPPPDDGDEDPQQSLPGNY